MRPTTSGLIARSLHPALLHKGKTAWGGTLKIVSSIFFLTLTLSLTGCSKFGHSLGPPAALTHSTDKGADWEHRDGVGLYHEAWNVIRTDYVDPTFNGQNWYRWRDRYDQVIKTRDDAYQAIDTMLGSLNDPYTRFLEPHKASDQNMHIDSKLSGVGIQIAAKGNQITVIGALDGSPAKKAGVLPLDQIIAVDNQPTANMDIDVVVDRIRGEKGTPVTLSLLRHRQRIEMKLIRDEIKIKTVFGEPVSKDIGYIRLSSFISQDAAQEMRQKLLAENKTRAMILDLRGNSGGLLPNALEIANMFMKTGKIVYMIDRDGTQRAFYAKSPSIYNKPLVVLIDGGSASASEILSGALKDNHRATLIGETTFGKGLVQKINYLRDNSELNVTISKYYTPAGHDIDKRGIEPDIDVPYTLSDFKTGKDPQKDAAIHYLKTHDLLAKQY